MLVRPTKTTQLLMAKLVIRQFSAAHPASVMCRRAVAALDEVATETGTTAVPVALNWLITRLSVARVIIGARNETQLRQNLGAVGWNLAVADAKARRGQCREPNIPVLAPAGLCRAEPVAGWLSERQEPRSRSHLFFGIRDGAWRSAHY